MVCGPTLLAEADHTSTPEPILARRDTGQSFSAAAGNDVLTCGKVAIGVIVGDEHGATGTD